MSLSFNQAKPGELRTVLEILDEAAAWLRQRGIEQWPERFSGVEDWRIARIRQYVNTGRLWLVRLGDEAAATVTILDEPDPDYAPGWHDPGDALYVCRMAVRPAYRGCRIGEQVLDWASTRAYREGKRWLRLDCDRRNRSLQRYYERQGFMRVDTLVVTIDSGGVPYTRKSGALYQRPAGSIYYGNDRTEPTMTDRYDPTGEAAVWQAAAELLNTLVRNDTSSDAESWNAALEQASRLLENESRRIRQRDGMYYRVITGQHHHPKAG